MQCPQACHYFGVKLTKVKLDAATISFTAENAAKYITPNTVALYASAPTFTHGVVDPIEDLGPLAEQHGIGLHVDNCLGGFLLSYMTKVRCLCARARACFCFCGDNVLTWMVLLLRLGPSPDLGTSASRG